MSIGDESYVPPWVQLHRYPFENADKWDTAKSQEWYEQKWLPTVPRFTPEGASCSCETHWKDLTDKHPPDFSSPEAFFEWGWARHDDVSREHSKSPRITLEQAYAVYWTDGKQ